MTLRVDNEVKANIEEKYLKRAYERNRRTAKRN